MHLLDWLSCSILGLKQPQMLGFILSSTLVPTGDCRTINGGIANWWNALQINAAVGNVLEMDDLDRASILHPGPVIIPAAIAAAEMTGASGEQLCQAVVRGYEATIRIGRAMGISHYTYFHNTSTCGVFGAAAAAADLLGLNAEQTGWALANAGSRTGGLWQMRHEACETKSVHNVMAAQTGVQAAMLAKQGVRGPLSLLEGPQGLFAAMSPHGDPKNVVANLNDDWRIHEVSFKPWPACRHAHPTIDAAIAIKAKMSDAAQTVNIKSITVKTYKSAINFCDCANPKTVMQAKFSLQHCAAIALLKGATSLADFDLENLNIADVAALRKKVQLAEDPALTGVFPNHYGAVVTVTFADGSQLEHRQTDAKGDPEIALTKPELIEKAAALLRASGIENATELIMKTLTLHLQKNVKHGARTQGHVQEWTRLWPLNTSENDE